MSCRRNTAIAPVALLRVSAAALVALASLWIATATSASGLGLAAPQVPPGAMGEGGYDGANPTVEARLLVDGRQAVEGEPIRVGVLFTMDPGWHIYWRNSGESGVPTRIEWNAAGATFGDLAWPAPQVFSESDGFITTYGYDGEVLLTSEAVFESGVAGTLALTADVGFLVCKISCIPGEITLSRLLDVVAQPQDAEPSGAGLRELFDAEAARVPVSQDALGVDLDVLYSQTAIRPDESFKAAIVVIPCLESDGECNPYTPRATPAGGPRGSRWTFVPDAVESVELKVSGQRPHPFHAHASLVNLTGESWSDDPGGDQRLRGVIALEDAAQRVHFVEVDLPLPRARAEAAVSAIDNPFLDPATGAPAARSEREATPPAQGSLLWALLLAFVGGIVLNAMPCVLPVLAIKIFAVAEHARRDRRELLAHGAAYTAGIVISMLALAAVVASLRSAGAAVGWGFQFQEPVFVAVVSTVLLVFALNLFGVFEIGFDPGRLGQVGQDAHGTRRSFFEGLLAVVLATPCSAPFLGTAIGFAFASPAPVIFAVFTAIGLGLASPYALVTLVPGWGRLVPKPGAWMLTFRKLLACALLATVVWLLWVAGRVAGGSGLLALIVFLAAVAGATWLAGRFQSRGEPQLARRVAMVASLVGAVALVFIPFDRDQANARDGEDATGTAARQGDDDAIRWQTFERDAVDAVVASGVPVLVVFTADWCITCKLNERVVLSDAAVQAELERLGVATFKADWTRRDEPIRLELARFGRAGVPMYLLYDPARPGDPALLPELLTVDRMLSALRDAAGSDRASLGADDPAGA